MMTLKHWIKEKVVSAAAAGGYELIANWKLERQPLVRHLRDLFALKQIDCVLDVGGNLGQFRDLLREDVGYSGWIVTFEPVARYVKVLTERSRQDDRWRVRGHALGSQEGSAIIHVTQSPGLNSFLAPRTDAYAKFWVDQAKAEEEVVSIRRLDDEFSTLQRELGFRSTYLKLDTQGFDMEVVKGGETVLPRVAAMQTEASVIPIYEGMPTHLEPVAALSARGFCLSGMFPVSHDPEMRLVEYDCVLINMASSST